MSAPVHDGETNLVGRANATGGGPSTLTISNKTTAGANRAGVVRFTTPGTVTNVTWNGVAMDLVASVTNAINANDLYAYIIVNPPTGASNIIITLDSDSEVAYLVTSYKDVNQANVVGDVQTATGSTANGSVVVPSSADGLVLDAINVGAVVTVGSGQIEEGSDLGGSDDFAGSRADGAASVTMDWTHSAINWGIIGFSLNGETVPVVVSKNPPPTWHHRLPSRRC